ncbi:hypothetical protein DPMN_031053 [Dreissena polymorpha]|uniref:Uncharacterized protein n=1 Tax=Dreissena polymorpha TaxID=45954 RepID=A0A9D4RGR4_DREPO|nr:hypothetical protein DPMN_031053 [Dreissena polymorpha]
MRSLPVPITMAVCTYLRYVANGDLQLTVGDRTGMLQATISHVCALVSNIVRFAASIDTVFANQGIDSTRSSINVAIL